MMAPRRRPAFRTLAVAVTGLLAIGARSVEAQAPKLLMETAADLNYNVRMGTLGEEPFRSFVRWLAEDGETAFAGPIVKIQGGGKYRPDGAAKNDYVSMAPYWWPNPAVPNGLPYIKRDGFVNPEVNDYPDKGNLVTGIGDYTISLAYSWYMARVIRGSFPRPADEYAKRAIDQLRVWFVNPETRMNPNMQFAQIRPGHSVDPEDGATGILDLSREIRLVEAISLLSSHKLFDSALQAGIRTWFAQMLTWLETSPSGQKASGSGNNIGIYMDGLIGIIKLYLGRPDAATFIRNACINRLNKHVRPSGEMPAETSRSDSLHYTFFALKGLVKLALLSDRVAAGGQFGTGVCWSHPNFKKAMAYPLPAALYDDKKLWPHKLQGSRGFKPQAGWELYYVAWLVWGNKDPYRFGDAQWKWSRKGAVGYWGRIWFPDPNTRTSVIGRGEASAARRRLTSALRQDQQIVYGDRSLSTLAVGKPLGSKVGSLQPEFEGDLCSGVDCQPFNVNGTVIYAALIDDYGA